MVRLSDIAGDKFHGSREISPRAMLYICERIMELDNSSSPDVAIQQIAGLCDTMMQAQSTMVQIFNTGNELLTDIEKSDTTEDVISRALAFLEGERFREAEKLDALARHIKPLYKDEMTILLHSHSSTANHLLVMAADKGYRFSVMVSEGRPMKEGRLTAAELAAHDIPVTLLCDAAAASAVGDVDVVLLGTDGVTTKGLINKTGSLAIALAGKHYDVPVHVLCTTKKFLPAKAGEVIIEEHEPAEVWGEPPSGVTVRNRYYEHVPFNLVSLMTEEGHMAEESVMKSLEHMPVSKLMKNTMA